MKKTILLLMSLLAMTSFAQKSAFTIADLYKIIGVSSPSVSPSDDKIVFVKSSSDMEKGKSYSNIVVMNTDGTAQQEITSNGKSYNPIWSADGKEIYYVSYETGTSQLFKYNFEKKSSEQLTDFSMGIDAPVLSPDNNLVAFASEVYPECGADSKCNALTDSLAANGPVQAYVANHLLFRHWTTYAAGKASHIIIFNLKDKTYTDVTPGKYISPTFMLGGGIGYNFSPDNQSLCYVLNHDEHPESSTNADLFIVPVTGGEAVNITKDNKAWDGSPIYSPDGKYIGYLTQLIPGYESDRFRIALYDTKTGKSTIITDKFDNWVSEFKWSNDSKSIYFSGNVEGENPVYNINVQSQKITSVIPEKAVSSFDFDKKGNVFYTYSTTEKPTALYSKNLKKGNENPLTSFNATLEKTVDIRPSDTMWVAGANGKKVEVFIVKPHNFDSNKKYPLVLNVHGGPQGQWMNSFRGDWQVYPGAGYVVAYPNPTGSTGYGQQYTRDISGDWGGKPFEDLMKVTDALANLSYVDSTRMGAMGWSYGGYMMNWFQAKTTRFKCLASMMGLYDLRSMWGVTEELWFPNFDLQGQPWNSELYKKFSPSEYVKNFATPTLIITGERDYRVSYTQSLQYFSTLQTLGIPSQLIVFKNDGHWPSNVKSMPLYYDAHLNWFHKYLGGEPAPYDVEKMVQNQVFYKK